MSEELPAKLAYSISEATQITPFGKTALYEDIAAGRLKVRKRGRSTFILAGDLADYLAAMPAVGAKQ